MSRLAIIPARGGSKRIPRKNIRLFLGKPIIAYSIETALKSRLFDEVMVSTDDYEIAEVARRLGANVPFMRSAKNSDDFATTVDVIDEVLAEYEKGNHLFEHGCCIYPTAPFVTERNLQDGFERLRTGFFDSVFPVVAFSYPVWRGLEIVDNKPQMIWKEYEKARSQDLTKVYHDAGQWYWFKISAVRASRSIFTSNSSCIELPERNVQDIDTLADWELAEYKFTFTRNSNRCVKS